ncbi:hypothetical protein KJ564_12860 [bacterium]|nr:hypothetical protein [bacterium]
MDNDNSELRWGTIYDADQLKNEIREITKSINLNEDFYYGTIDTGNYFQGDIIHFKASVPIFDISGTPFLYDSFEFWLIVSNSCDLVRDEVSWAILVPLICLPKDLDTSDRSAFTRYKYSRVFFIPHWSDSEDKTGFCANFLLPVIVEKGILNTSNIRKVAQMSRRGWILLHSCLVRFLARDDGRYEI